MSRSVAANKISADLKRFSAGCDYACEPSTGPEPGSVSKDSTMKTQHNMHRNLPGHLALLGLVGALVVPSVSAAASLVPGVPAPVAASDDDNDCAPAVVALQIDVSTGEVYIVNDVGGLTLTDNQITVHFGSQTSVIVDIEYSSGDFEVEISPAGGSTVVRSTRGGALRYKISDKGNVRNDEHDPGGPGHHHPAEEGLPPFDLSRRGSVVRARPAYTRRASAFFSSVTARIAATASRAAGPW
jgi:hypothetical protein